MDAAALAFGACRNKVLTGLGDGHHNPGQDCQNACHNHGFTLSGTLYNNTAGATPVTGGSISVKDANGVVFDMVSELNGNFYTTRTVAFPVMVVASSCPTVKPMSATIAAGNGGCNKSGCHVPGVGQGAIHVP